MPFQIKAMSRFATSDRGSNKQTNFYVYSTPDAAATVSAAGYFDGAAVPQNLKKGDRINCIVSVDGTPAKLDLVVTAISSSNAVTVAA